MDQVMGHLIALVTLTALEIVLGIDNIIFLTLLVDKLPQACRERVRKTGLGLAMFARCALLLGISWLTHLTTPLFSFWTHVVTGKDLVLVGGGVFLIAKATHELSGQVKEAHLNEQASPRKIPNHPVAIFAQIVMMDLIFSLDSVITAVGMAQSVVVMILAVVIAVGIMMRCSGFIGRFIEERPSLKVLALAFLILVGVTLVAEGTGQHMNKGYIYFAMTFSFAVEMINSIRTRKLALAKVESDPRS